MATVSGVEHRDIASGKVARAFSGPFDILNEGPNAGSNNKRPARWICTLGAVTYVGLDGVEVILPAPGVMFKWEVQATEIVSGDGIVIY